MINFIKTALADTISEGERAIQQGLVRCGNPGQPNCATADFWQLIHNLINIGIYAAVIAVGLSVVYGGAKMMLSFGSGEKLGAAKGAIAAAVTGLIIVLTAWLIVNTIVSSLVPGCGNWYNFGVGKVCGR